MTTDWFRPRNYLHFDRRLSWADRPEIARLVTSPTLVSEHRFVPFLHFKKDKPKIEFKPGKGRRYVPGYRNIYFAAHVDAQIYSFYSQMLNDKYESKLHALGLSDSVIAFRKIQDPASKIAKSNIEFANEAFRKIATYGNCRVHAFDVKKFFDSLDRRLLKQGLKRILGLEGGLPDDYYKILRSLTNFKFVDRAEAYEKYSIPKTRGKDKKYGTICSFAELNRAASNDNLVRVCNEGIPQGSPISAVLANLYMLDFDVEINKAVSGLGGLYLRYCDDILIITPPEIEIELLVQSELNKLKLRLNDKKTHISNFSLKDGHVTCDKAIQYLGFSFEGRHERISLRPGSIAHFRSRLTKSVNLVISTAKVEANRRERLGLEPTHLFIKKLRRRFSHLGKRNFISYAQRAKATMMSKAIHVQIKGLDKFLESEIHRAREAFRTLTS